jgi:hypothetical protein
LFSCKEHIAEASSEVVQNPVGQSECSSHSGWVMLQRSSTVSRSSTAHNASTVQKQAPRSLDRLRKKPQEALYTPPPPRPDEVSHVRTNSEGDLGALLMSLMWSGIGLLLVLVIFDYLRKEYPKIYANNARADAVPGMPSKSFLGWCNDSMKLTQEEIIQVTGLDRAMLLEFLNMCIWLCAVVSFPMVVMCILHEAYGGEAGDPLGKLDLANIRTDSPLCLIHALLVWYVVVSCQKTMRNAYDAFLPRRIRWLKELPSPRSNTVLVEGIPPHLRTDAKLKEYFEHVFPGPSCVHSAAIVKHTDDLISSVQLLANTRLLLRQAEFVKDQGAVDRLQSKVDALELQVKSERERVTRDISAGHESIHSSAGFVTFEERRDKEAALNLRCTSNDGELVIAMPPDPADIYFADLQLEPSLRRYWSFVGDMMILLMFLAFLPIVVIISSITRLHTLQMYLPIFYELVRGLPHLESTWDGMMASSILTCMTGFVPGILVSIFRCYALKFKSRVQLHIHVWYYYFLIVFVLFVTVLGNSLIDTVLYVVATPHSIVHRLAVNLPKASHFYLTFLVVQTFFYGLGLLRPGQLWRYTGYLKVCEEEEARKLADPDNDAYNEMGFRSAMFSFNLVIALVFCSITPLISVVALGSFVLARIFFGYLIVFAEPTLPDIGGEFWYLQLRQTQQGLFIYIVLMSAILAHKSSSWIPPIIALSTLVYFIPQYNEFRRGFKRWDLLPLEDIAPHNHPKMSADWGTVTYVQPELIAPAA